MKSDKEIEKTKRPFYKKRLFWIILVIIGIIEIITFVTPNEKSNKIISSNGNLAQKEQEAIKNQNDEEKITVSIGKKNALRSAKNYLNLTGFSKSGLIHQLEFEGYSTEDATYAANNCNADWNKQAAKSAKNYIDTMPFSKSALIEQLRFEGYSASEAEYGAKSVGY